MSTAVFPFEVWPEGITQARIPANDNSLRSEVLAKAALTIADSEPGSPSDGDLHIVGTAWGDFSTGDVVIYKGSTWLGFEPFTGWLKHNEDDDKVYRYSAGWSEFAGGGGGPTTVAIPIACSDETTSLTTGTSKVTFRMPHAMTVTEVRASLTTAQTSGSIFTVDINEGGSTILSTKLTIDNTEKTSTTAATPAVISDSTLADDAEITIDIDQVGDGTAKGLKVYLIGTI